MLDGLVDTVLMFTSFLKLSWKTKNAMMIAHAKR